MHPSITEQLDGIRRVLAMVIAPQVTDPYAADVLAGAIGTLETLCRWSDVPAFMRDDAEQTAALLSALGIAVPALAADPLDLDALAEHHRAVRSLLESAMPAVMADPDSRAAVVALFRERAARFPLTNRRAGQQPSAPPTGGPRADTAR